MPPLLPVLGHATVGGAMLFAFLSIRNLTLQSPAFQQTGGHWQFLTIQGLALAIVTMSLCLLSDFVGSGLTQIRRFFLLVSLPLSATISAIYWGLIIFMPELILPPSPKQPEIQEPTSQYADEPQVADLYRIPFKLDITLHLLPFLALTTHFLLFETKYTRREAFVTAPAAAAGFGLYYASFAEYCAKQNGYFTYPFLNVEFKYRVPIYLGAVLIAWSAFTVVNAVHGGSPRFATLYRDSKVLKRG